MARSRETKIELTAYDDLFQTDESREEAKLSKIRDIPISEIDEFPDHPFKVLMDEDMEQLVESIKRNGVMTPATVRLKEDGRYELISGHRRKKACELAGLETLKCEVKELTRDEAIIVMVESNLQRSVILPSEKAFAYKMRLEAMNRQAGRPSKDNLTPMVSDLDTTRTNEKLGKEVGESREQIRRYIRLTELVPEILQMVDERQIAFRPAVEISYLTEEQQYTLLEAMEYNDATPSLAQAIKMKKYNQDGKLTSEVIQSIMEEEKPNQKGKPAFRDERITKLIPKTVPRGQETDFVVKALEFYNRHLDAKGEVLLTILSSLAQDESRSISENSTWGIRKRFEQGKFSVNTRKFMGYDSDESGNLIVNEEQAKIVWMIYEKYLCGRNYFVIARELNEAGIPGRNGKVNWIASTIETMLHNEKYKGDALLQKTYTVDFLTKKREKNQGQIAQYYVENNHPAIVKPEIWEAVQLKEQRRREYMKLHHIKAYSSDLANNPFASKIICGECGEAFGRKNGDHARVNIEVSGNAMLGTE